MANGIASFKWTGRSGMQIGSADANPYDKYGPSFTADEVHGQNYNPNSSNTYEEKPDIGEVPVNIQDEYATYEEGDNGWVLDNIQDPWHGDRAGTAGHETDMGGHGRRLDAAHGEDVFQLNLPRNHGIHFYGPIDNQESYYWQSSQTPNPNTRAFPAEAREVTQDWPEPFDSYTVAAHRPVQLDTERIPMRRMLEDDRPVYRQLAIPGQNIKPSGSVYNPTYPSNPVLYNVKPLPSFGRTPVAPWSQDEMASPDMQSQDGEYADVTSGMGLQ
jgi:hypothetical protein